MSLLQTVVFHPQRNILSLHLQPPVIHLGRREGGREGGRVGGREDRGEREGREGGRIEEKERVEEKGWEGREKGGSRKERDRG